MPDAHGTATDRRVLATDNAVIPYAVGYRVSNETPSTIIGAKLSSANATSGEYHRVTRWQDVSSPSYVMDEDSNVSLSPAPRDSAGALGTSGSATTCRIWRVHGDASMPGAQSGAG
jgi:hypothetical protein